MKFIARACLFALMSFAVASAAQAGGSVVITNRTTQPVTWSLARPDRSPDEIQLQPGELVSLFVAADAEVTFDTQGAAQRTPIVPNSAYAFVARSDGLQLEPVSVARGTAASEKPNQSGQKPAADSPDA